MNTYKFSIAKICVVELDGVNLVKVYNLENKLVHSIQTTTKGRKAARLAFHDAMRCRLI